MSTYVPAPKAVLSLVDEILNRYEEHKQLVDAGVKIDVLLAYGKESKSGEIGDAIKLHGVKCLGTIKRTGLKERVLGHGDALLLLDGNWWQEATDAEKAALIDHECYHLDLKRDETMAIVVDDHQRPCLLMRPHDYEMGEFILIAKRHGMASQECKLMARIKEDAGQFFWPGIADWNGKQIQSSEEETAASQKFLNGVRSMAGGALVAHG